MKRYFINALIIDGTGKDPIEGGCIAVDGRRITAVGRNSDFSPESGSEVVDVRGKSLVPGFFNCHGHLAWDSVGNLKDQSLNDSGEIAGFKCARSMGWCLDAGVTTFRDLGVHLTGLRAREAQASGLVQGPRVVSSGAAITQTGGHTYWCAVQADGADEVRRTVREQLRLGADLIKVMASGGSGEPGEVADLPEFTVSELQAAAEEAHRLNKPITAHATGTQAARNIADAGFDCCEHGAPFDEATIDLMVNKRMFMVPTLTPLFIQAERGLEGGMHPSLVERRKRQIQDHNRFRAMAAAGQAGVRVALGTDAGSPMVPHNLIGYEMKCLLQLGIVKRPMDVLMCATKTAAELCGVSDKLGTLEASKLADIVVLSGNPLEDVAVFDKVSAVWMEGEKVR